MADSRATLGRTWGSMLMRDPGVRVFITAALIVLASVLWAACESDSERVTQLERELNLLKDQVEQLQSDLDALRAATSQAATNESLVIEKTVSQIGSPPGVIDLNAPSTLYFCVVYSVAGQIAQACRSTTHPGGGSNAPLDVPDCFNDALVGSSLPDACR